ncbi:HupE/UreJ family protein [Vibrio sp. S4B1]|nr:HupE/UreJ family protein [Vibrio methylphosphonaticus]
MSGFLHPLFGLDHVMAMVAVGLWGAFLRKPAIWQLPVIFPMMMAFGGALGIAGVQIPAVEFGIALSSIVLGIMVALGARVHLEIAYFLVGIFAIFHGHAHGTELPSAAAPLVYSFGFVVSTGLLHLAGVGVGMLAEKPERVKFVKAVGVAIVFGGTAFLFGIA